MTPQDRAELDANMAALRADLAALSSNPMIPHVVRGAVFKAVRVLEILIEAEERRDA